MPSLLTVNQIGHKRTINTIKQGKISLEEIRKISLYSLDSSNKEHTESILNECDLEKVTRGFSFIVSCWEGCKYNLKNERMANKFYLKKQGLKVMKVIKAIFFCFICLKEAEKYIDCNPFYIR